MSAAMAGEMTIMAGAASVIGRATAHLFAQEGAEAVGVCHAHAMARTGPALAADGGLSPSHPTLRRPEDRGRSASW